MKTYLWLQSVLLLLELIAACTGLANWKKCKHTYWKWFVIYLVLIFVFEVTGHFLLYGMKYVIPSRHFYNYLVIPAEFLFFYWLYYSYFKPAKARYWAVAAIFIYLAGWLINTFLLPVSNFWSLPFSYMAGIVALLMLTMVFFFRFILGDDILTYKTDMMFWVSLALLVFYMVSSPFYGLRDTLYRNYRNVFWAYSYIQFGANYLMYILFAAAFIWGRPR